MVSLALIGNQIKHSKSEETYESLLKIKLNYKLLDFDTEKRIPEIEKLFQQFDGISITSPYKKHFLGKVTLSESSELTNAINCIYKSDETFFGANTDYLAMLVLLKEMSKEFCNVVILGNGVMAQVSELALKKLGMSYEIISRAVDGPMEKINIVKESSTLIINCCARSFYFEGNVGDADLFWDLNYSHHFHEKHFEENKLNYLDGRNLLLEQARLAITFWKL
jgi:shikimate dehydrogenase